MKWKVDRSKIHGNGVFATQDISKDKDIGVGIVLYYDDKNVVVFLRNTFGLLINESKENPNVRTVKIGKDFHFVSLRSIKENEEIVTDYQDYMNRVEEESLVTGKRIIVL